MKKIERLIVRSTVVFTRKPTGSWLTENEPYIVEANGGKTVHFRNPVTGGGTYDQAWAIEQSEFTVNDHFAAGDSNVRFEPYSVL